MSAETSPGIPSSTTEVPSPAAPADPPPVPAPPKATPTLLAFASGRGGTGKTLLAANVAVYLAQIGKRVVAVDADPAGGTPVVAAGPRTIVLPEGIRIGAEHTPGRYRVTAWVTERPSTRAGAGDMIRDNTVRAHDSFEIEVLP